MVFKKPYLMNTTTRFCMAIFTALAMARASVGYAEPAATIAVVDPLDRPAMQISTQLMRTALLHMVRVGKRLLAVGERGAVLLSDDEGRSWRQALSVPVAVTLTAVQFINDKKGWAVGHGGVVLTTEDGGEHWSRQLDGLKAAALAMEEAEFVAKSPNGARPDAIALIRNAKQLAADGADKPFLDLYFENEKSGLVVGAYGIAYRTLDGGKTWTPWMGHLDNPKGLHLNAVRATPSGIWIVGERGLVLRAGSLMQDFTVVKTPYGGSYFTALALEDGVVIAGLKGHAYLTVNSGKRWTDVSLPVPISSVSAGRIDGVGIVLTNQAGQILVGKDVGHLVVAPIPPLPPVTAVLATADGNWIAATLRGPARFPAPSVGTR
ncbi:MAG: hypothetical protein EKK46_10815 [Rhodocyclaceae bacterium]|nr:MAG: hypothetical protein EKK46_10815 [Rhodocyclaceae bacterium]